MFCSKLWHWCEKRLGRQSPVMLHHSIYCVACTTDLPLLDIMCCVCWVHLLQLPELGYWKHGSKQHVEGTASVGVARGRSLAHQPHAFAIEQWQALLEAWQNSHTHTIPFKFQSFSVLVLYVSECFIMFHHLSIFFK